MYMHVHLCIFMPQLCIYMYMYSICLLGVIYQFAKLVVSFSKVYSLPGMSSRKLESAKITGVRNFHEQM